MSLKKLLLQDDVKKPNVKLKMGILLLLLVIIEESLMQIYWKI